MENILRSLVKKKPDHAQALNALGYSMADANKNLNEAFDLIKAALTFAPQDPHIIDSMGFDAVFDIRHYAPNQEPEVEALPQVNLSEGEVCKKVVEAHRILMGMNDENKAKFCDLVDVLERQCSFD